MSGNESVRRLPEHSARTIWGDPIFRGDLRGTRWTGFDLSRALFVDVDLSGAVLEDVVLERADLSSVKLQGARLIRVRAGGSTLHRAMLAETELTECDFSYARLRWSTLDDVVVSDCDFSGACLDRTNWTRSRLTRCNLAGDFHDAVFENVVFTDCSLKRANLGIRGPRLFGAATDTTFLRCDLRGTDWAGFNLFQTRFIDCRLGGARGTPLVVEVNIERPDVSPKVPDDYLGDDYSLQLGGREDVLSLWRIPSGTASVEPRWTLAPGVDEKTLVHLVELCAESPEEDEPRLVWADAIGGARGELVMLQCELARGGHTPAAARTLRKRIRRLLEMHGGAWSGLSRFAHRWQFRRGFVEAVEMDAAVLLQHSNEVFSIAPLLRSITLCGISGLHDLDNQIFRGPDTLEILRRVLALLANDTRAARIQGLALDSAGTDTIRNSEFGRFEPLGDEAVELVVESPVFERLRSFGIARSRCGPRAIAALSQRLRSIERLSFREHLPSELAAQLLTAEAPKVRALTLKVSSEDIMSMIPPVTNLRLVGLTDEGLARLASSPAAASVERLALEYPDLENLLSFARFPRLRALHLSERELGRGFGAKDAIVHQLIAQRISTLREFSLWLGDVEETSLRELVMAYWPQLEHLEVHGSYLFREIAGKLAAEMNGDLVVGPSEEMLPNPPILHV